MRGLVTGAERVSLLEEPSLLTIQQVVDTIIAAIPGGRKPKTVDTVKTSDAAQPVKGVVTPITRVPAGSPLYEL